MYFSELFSLLSKRRLRRGARWIAISKPGFIRFSPGWKVIYSCRVVGGRRYKLPRRPQHDYTIDRISIGVLALFFSFMILCCQFYFGDFGTHYKLVKRKGVSN